VPTSRVASFKPTTDVLAAQYVVTRQHDDARRGASRLMAPHLMKVAGPFIFADRGDGSVAQET
jgi:hypothetical protein